MKRPKYGNRRVTVDGITFDSQAEHRRWCELKLLERAGEIRTLRRQLNVPLVVNGVRITSIRCDFAYFRGQKEVWDEHKVAPTKTRAWTIRWKLAQAMFPAVEFCINGVPCAPIKRVVEKKAKFSIKIEHTDLSTQTTG